MSAGIPTIPDELIRARLLAIYRAAEPTGIRPTQRETIGNLAVGYDRIKRIRDAMVATGELPDLCPNTGGASGKRVVNLAKAAAPIVARPVIERESPSMPVRAAAPAPTVPPEPGQYRRPASVKAALAAEKDRREYGHVLRQRIAEREAKTAMT